jgi:hypothetical protein
MGPSQRPYLTTHNTHKRHSNAPVGFEPTIPASERPGAHALDRAATEIACQGEIIKRSIFRSKLQILNGILLLILCNSFVFFIFSPIYQTSYMKIATLYYHTLYYTRSLFCEVCKTVGISSTGNLVVRLEDKKIKDLKNIEC